jgi:hypothetical protein
MDYLRFSIYVIDSFIKKEIIVLSEIGHISKLLLISFLRDEQFFR